MLDLRRLCAAVALALSVAVPAVGQELSYRPGSVWNLSYVKVEPGQLQRYLDFLSGDWKKINELGKREGYVVSYHVLAVNNARAGEPDLILAVETKDYFRNAEQLAQQKSIDAMLASNQRRMEEESGARVVMRKLVGSMELQELILK